MMMSFDDDLLDVSAAFKLLMYIVSVVLVLL